MLHRPTPKLTLAVALLGCTNLVGCTNKVKTDSASSSRDSADSVVLPPNPPLVDAKGVPLVPLEPALPAAGNGLYTFKTSTAPLYGDTGLPSRFDINQGQLSDCALLSTLTAFAFEAPDILSQHIKLLGKDKVGDEVYSVRLYYPHPDPSQPPVPIDVGVSNKLLYDADGNTFDNQGSPLWPTLVEKAFALLNDKHRMVDLDNPKEMGLQALQGGMKMQVALQAVTGEIPQSVFVNGASTSVDVNTVGNLWQQQTDKKIIATMDFDTEGGLTKLKALATAHNLPFDGTTASLPNGFKLSVETLNPNGGLHLQITDKVQLAFFPNHAYAAEGFFSGSSVTDVIIDNPWNRGVANGTDPELGDSSFAMPLTDFMVFVREIAYVNLPTK